MREVYISPVHLMSNIEPLIIVAWTKLMRQGITQYIQMPDGLFRILALHPEICAASILPEKP